MNSNTFIKQTDNSNTFIKQTDNSKCVICLNNTCQFYTQPCLHLIYCEKCVTNNNISKDKCPLCRETIYNVISKNDINNKIKTETQLISDTYARHIQKEVHNKIDIKKIEKNIIDGIIKSNKIINQIDTKIEYELNKQNINALIKNIINIKLEDSNVNSLVSEYVKMSFSNYMHDNECKSYIYKPQSEYILEIINKFKYNDFVLYNNLCKIIEISNKVYINKYKQLCLDYIIDYSGNKIIYLKDVKIGLINDVKVDSHSTLLFREHNNKPGYNDYDLIRLLYNKFPVYGLFNLIELNKENNRNNLLFLFNFLRCIKYKYSCEWEEVDIYYNHI